MLIREDFLFKLAMKQCDHKHNSDYHSEVYFYLCWVNK